MVAAIIIVKVVMTTITVAMVATIMVVAMSQFVESYKDVADGDGRHGGN